MSLALNSFSDPTKPNFRFFQSPNRSHSFYDSFENVMKLKGLYETKIVDFEEKDSNVMDCVLAAIV